MLQVVQTLPVLSSDDDSSDEENSQSSGDEPKGDGGASPPSVSDGGPAPTSESQGGAAAKDEASADAADTDHATTTPLPQGQEVFLTTTDFYLVLRLHHVLAQRLAEAKKLCREAGLSRQTVVASPQEVCRFWYVYIRRGGKVRIALPSPMILCLQHDLFAWSYRCRPLKDVL